MENKAIGSLIGEDVPDSVGFQSFDFSRNI